MREAKDIFFDGGNDADSAGGPDNIGELTDPGMIWTQESKRQGGESEVSNLNILDSAAKVLLPDIRKISENQSGNLTKSAYLKIRAMANELSNKPEIEAVLVSLATAFEQMCTQFDQQAIDHFNNWFVGREGINLILLKKELMKIYHQANEKRRENFGL